MNTTEIRVFEYNGAMVEFDLQPNALMVNATEMGALYGKLPKDFLKTDETKNFILECLKKENYPFLKVEKEEDLVYSRQKSGTWMHRILALKFAAWLNPAFELWVYRTIDEVLFGAYRQLEESLKESAQRKLRIEQLRTNLLESETYRELERLELEERQAKYTRGKANKNQLSLFITQAAV